MDDERKNLIDFLIEAARMDDEGKADEHHPGELGELARELGERAQPTRSSALERQDLSADPHAADQDSIAA